MDGKFDGVEVFLAAADLKSFSRAAERLHITRSAVTKSIARLETRLGAQLFMRTTRSVILTESGHLYYERCKRASDELNRAHAMIEAGKQEVSGTLRVTMPILFGRYCIAPGLLALAESYPELGLELVMSDKPTDLLADRLDLGVRIGRLSPTSDLKARRLPDLRFVLCASPDYLARHPVPSTIAQLADQELVVFMRNERPMPWQVESTEGELVEFHPQGRLRFDHMEAVADAAVKGFGVAWLPHWLVRERLGAGILVEIWPDRRSGAMECHLIWPAAPNIPQRVRHAIDAIVSGTALWHSAARLSEPGASHHPSG